MHDNFKITGHVEIFSENGSKIFDQHNLVTNLGKDNFLTNTFAVLADSGVKITDIYLGFDSTKDILADSEAATATNLYGANAVSSTPSVVASSRFTEANGAITYTDDTTTPLAANGTYSEIREVDNQSVSVYLAYKANAGKNMSTVSLANTSTTITPFTGLKCSVGLTSGNIYVVKYTIYM